MKTKSYDQLVIGIIVGTLAFAIIQYVIVHFIGIGEPKAPVKDYKDVGGNIDIEYYLEVSEDSIWIENYETHRVYGGKYSDLDSLINKDNL
jgi:hypothetical protein